MIYSKDKFKLIFKFSNSINSKFKDLSLIFKFSKNNKNAIDDKAKF